MFVRINNTSDNDKNWYKQGEVHEVENFSCPHSPSGRMLFRILTNNSKFIPGILPGIAVADCEIIGMSALFQGNSPVSLEEQLEVATASVASLQKQIENRPLTQDQYDVIVAKWRASAKRSKWLSDIDNWTAVISMDQTSPMCRSTNISYLCFGVCFHHRQDCVAAILNVGADNLRKAMQFDMQIGM